MLMMYSPTTNSIQFVLRLALVLSFVSQFHQHHQQQDDGGGKHRRLIILGSAGATAITATNFRSRPRGKVLPPRRQTQHNHHVFSSPATASTTSTTSSRQRIVAQLLAGGISRSLAQIVLYPIDALRTLKQTRDHRTLKDVGAGALVRGCTTTSSFALVMGAVQFAVFDVCRERYNLSPLLSSIVSAGCSCVVSIPQEVIKQRLVSGIYTSFGEAVKSIYTADGLLGFYNSWLPTMSRNVPFVVTTFLTMDILKRKRLQQLGKNKTKKKDLKGNNISSSVLSTADNLLLGVSSAFVAGCVTQPADVIKTRMMTQAASSQIPYKSAIDCLVTIIRQEGPLTLYTGFKQRSIYMCSLWGITFALNGKLKSLLLTSQQPQQKRIKMLT